MANGIFEVITPGLLTTLQDLGRFGSQYQGIPTAGAMDVTALVIGNRLVQNDPSEVGLEITFYGPKLRVLTDVTVAVTGGNLSPKVDGDPLPMWETVYLRKGSVLSFGPRQWGIRSYLTVSGGVDAEPLLGSKSTDLRSGFGGYQGRAIQKGDLLEGSTLQDENIRSLRFPEELIRKPGQEQEIRVILGPELHHFTNEAVQLFTQATYTISDKMDRMGMRLKGTEINHSEKGPNILTNATPLGAVQIPGDGQPIILLKDRQTAGGYPKIAVTITPDISMLAQMGPGSKLRFKSVSLEEAHQLLEEYQQLMDFRLELIEN